MVRVKSFKNFVIFFLIIKKRIIKKEELRRNRPTRKGSLVRNTSRNETLRTIAKKERIPKGILERPASKGVRGRISYPAGPRKGPLRPVL